MKHSRLFCINDPPSGRNESPLVESPRKNKDVDCLSHYVCGKFAFANGLFLLKNIYDLSTLRKMIQ